MSISTDAAVCVWRADPGVCIARRQLPPGIGRPCALAALQYPTGALAEPSGASSTPWDCTLGAQALLAITFPGKIVVMDLHQLQILHVIRTRDQRGLLAIGGMIVPPVPQGCSDSSAADAAAASLALARSSGSRSRAQLATVDVPGAFVIELTGVEASGALWQWRGSVGPVPLDSVLAQPQSTRDGGGGGGGGSRGVAPPPPCPVLGWASPADSSARASLFASTASSSSASAKPAEPASRRATLQAAAVGPNGRSALLVSAEGWVVLPVHPDRDGPEGNLPRGSPSGGSSGTGRFASGIFLTAGMIALTGSSGETEGAPDAHCSAALITINSSLAHVASRYYSINISAMPCLFDHDLTTLLPHSVAVWEVPTPSVPGVPSLHSHSHTARLLQRLSGKPPRGHPTGPLAPPHSSQGSQRPPSAGAGVGAGGAAAAQQQPSGPAPLSVCGFHLGSVQGSAAPCLQLPPAADWPPRLAAHPSSPSGDGRPPLGAAEGFTGTPGTPGTPGALPSPLSLAAAVYVVRAYPGDVSRPSHSHQQHQRPQGGNDYYSGLSRVEIFRVVAGARTLAGGFGSQPGQQRPPSAWARGLAADSFDGPSAGAEEGVSGRPQTGLSDMETENDTATGAEGGGPVCVCLFVGGGPLMPRWLVRGHESGQISLCPLPPLADSRGGVSAATGGGWLCGHTAAVRCLAQAQGWAADPSTPILLSGSDDCTVRIWAPLEHAALAVLRHHCSPVISLHSAPPGCGALLSRIALSASADGQLALVSLQSCQLERLLRGRPVASSPLGDPAAAQSSLAAADGAAKTAGQALTRASSEIGVESSEMGAGGAGGAAGRVTRVAWCSRAGMVGVWVDSDPEELAVWDVISVRLWPPTTRPPPPPPPNKSYFAALMISFAQCSSKFCRLLRLCLSEPAFFLLCDQLCCFVPSFGVFAGRSGKASARGAGARPVGPTHGLP